MATSAIYACVLLLAAATLQAVVAIGPCNNTIIEQIMTANADNCPTDLLEQVSPRTTAVYSVILTNVLLVLTNNTVQDNSFVLPILLKMLSRCWLE